MNPNGHSTSTSSLVKFNATDVAGVRQHYDQHGFVVLRQLIDHSLIDKFLVEYQRIKVARTFVYESQSIHRAIRPEMNEHGFIRESILNPSRIGLFRRFAAAVKHCIYDEAVAEALTALDGHERHVSWQDMFFDLSTGTIDHADTWYMDTDPPGSLVGAWFALERIDVRAGTFFLMPGSHRVPPLDKGRYARHEEFRIATLKFVEEHGFRPLAMPIDKGDAIFWHPFLVHGAFANQDARFSRKSLTSHFFPHGAVRQGMAATPLQATFNPRMDRVKHPSDAFLNLALFAKFAFDTVRGRTAKMDMRRQSYTT